MVEVYVGDELHMLGQFNVANSQFQQGIDFEGTRQKLSAGLDRGWGWCFVQEDSKVADAALDDHALDFDDSRRLFFDCHVKYLRSDLAGELWEEMEVVEWLLKRWHDGYL